MDMRKVLHIISVVLLAVSCKVELTNPYEKSTFEVKVDVAYPEEYQGLRREGIDVTATDVNLGNSYTGVLDDAYTVTFRLPNGIYSIKMSDKVDENIFNANESKVVVNGAPVRLELMAKRSKAGSLIIKEIYCGGCTKQDNSIYQSDKYVIIHNNDCDVQYLDGICFGALYPHNSASVSMFVDVDSDGGIVYRDYVAIAEAMWSFPGSGNDFPLNPGEDAVLCITGAIDHSATYPQSVNLNNSDYFVCYDNNAFTNTIYHPTPGSEIRSDHYMTLVSKVGKSTAYAFSMNSPAVVLYKVDGMTPAEFVNTADATMPIPGATNGAMVVKIPNEWVIDAVEVFNGGSSSNYKRFPSDLDAGYVYLSATGKCHTLMRRTDEENTASQGYEVLIDTNDSSNDFYERETQSLHE